MAKLQDALELLKSGQEGVLGTQEGEFPYLSLAAYSYEEGAKFGKLLFWISGLARHTRNLQKNPAAGFLAAEAGEKAVYEKKRVSCRGRMTLVEDVARVQEFKKNYAHDFPRFSMLASFPDFRLFEMVIEEIHFIAGFGQTETFS